MNIQKFYLFLVLVLISLKVLLAYPYEKLRLGDKYHPQGEGKVICFVYELACSKACQRRHNLAVCTYSTCECYDLED